MNKSETWVKKTVKQLQVLYFLCFKHFYISKCKKWTGWPDHGVPNDSDHEIIKSMISKLIDYYLKSQASKKIAIHCSAGIGRTGTLIALFNLTLTLLYYEASFRSAKSAGIRKNLNIIYNFLLKMQKKLANYLYLDVLEG